MRVRDSFHDLFLFGQLMPGSMKPKPAPLTNVPTIMKRSSDRRICRKPERTYDLRFTIREPRKVGRVPPRAPASTVQEFNARVSRLPYFALAIIAAITCLLTSPPTQAPHSSLPTRSLSPPLRPRPRPIRDADHGLPGHHLSRDTERPAPAKQAVREPQATIMA